MRHLCTLPQCGRLGGIWVTPEEPQQVDRQTGFQGFLLIKAPGPNMSFSHPVKGTLVIPRLGPAWNPGQGSHISKHWAGNIPHQGAWLSQAQTPSLKAWPLPLHCHCSGCPQLRLLSSR